jgi:hypothetical protein
MFLNMMRTFIEDCSDVTSDVRFLQCGTRPVHKYVLTFDTGFLEHP